MVAPFAINKPVVSRETQHSSATIVTGSLANSVRTASVYASPAPTSDQMAPMIAIRFIQEFPLFTQVRQRHGFLAES